MKKIVIPIIIAAVLGAGGVVATVALNKPSTAVADNEVGAPEIAEGKYYLNGDVNSGAYFELTDSTLKLNFDVDGYAMVYDACINEGWDEWNADHTANMFLLDYCKENPYTVFNLEHLTTIDIERHYANMNDDGTHADDIGSFKYDGKSISCSPLGDFTLVE